MHRYRVTRWRQKHQQKDLFNISPPGLKEIWETWENRWPKIILFSICISIVGVLFIWDITNRDKILKQKAPVYRRLTIESQGK